MSRLNDFDFSELTRDERLFLANQLYESVLIEDDPLTPEQLAEMHRRLEALESGEDKGVDWETLRRELP